MALQSQFYRGSVVARRHRPSAPTASSPTGGPLGPQAVTAPSVVPPDANYEAAIASSQQSHDITAGDLTRQRAQGLLDYGYTQDATGALTFDATNPFSQAAMLKRNYDQAQRGNTNSYAARGQLYSGALQNAQDESGFQYQRGSDTLTKGLADFLARNTSAGAQNDVNLGISLGQAAGTRLQNAPDNPLYQPQIDTAASAVSTQDAANAANGGAPRIQTNYRAPSGKVGTLKIYPNGRKVFIPN